jgi:hypothetical protein
MNEEESIAMWKLYAAREDSICIQSTYKKLSALLPEQCFLGMVRYINYSRDVIDFSNSLNFITHKRTGFEHERELRAVIWRVDQIKDVFSSLDDKGLVVPIENDALIERVYLSPDADSILETIVGNLNRTYGVSAPIHKSQANAPPDY